MKFNGGGQNIVQPKSSGGGFLGQLFGGLSSMGQAKQRFQLQQAIMDHAHENKLKEIAFKGVLGAHTNAATIEMGSDALSRAYQKHYGEGWQDVLKQHIGQGSITEKGVVGPRANIAVADINAANRSKEDTEPTKITNQTPGTSSPVIGNPVAGAGSRNTNFNDVLSEHSAGEAWAGE